MGKRMLTDRQLELIRMLTAGYTAREIAQRLGIAPREARPAVRDVLRILSAYPDPEAGSGNGTTSRGDNSQS